VARVTIEDCLRRVKNRYMLVHAAAKRVRQMGQGAGYLVDSPKNEEIVMALREIAAGKFSVEGWKTEDHEAKRGVEMEKAERKRVTTRKTQTTVNKTTVKKSAPKKTAKQLASKKAPARTAGIKKEYLEGGKVCKVTFKFPKIAAPDAKRVCIVGDFNNWNIHANPMKRLKNGDYQISLKVEPKKEYQFRYLIDESRWENDWSADKYMKSPYGDSDNSVIIV